MLNTLTQILDSQSDEGLTDRQVIVKLHNALGRSALDTSVKMGIKLLYVANDLSSMGISTEGIVTEPAPVRSTSAQALSDTLKAAFVSSAPKVARKAAPTKPTPSASATALKSMSPLEVDVAQWQDVHVLRYIEIRWSEMKWQTPCPSWGVKDRANVKRLRETYGADTRKIIDVVFDHWTTLQAKFSWTGFPSTGMIWGFRNSLAPIAFGDVSVTQGSKAWGSSHKTDNDRDDGDEVGW